MEKLGYFSVRKPYIVHETIDGETVIVNLETGVYYSLRNSGADVWDLLETSANLDELTSSLSERYDGSPEEIRNIINELIIILQKEGIVQVSSTRQSVSQKPGLVVSSEKTKFIPPVLEKFSDLQDLLLLDPIHEVDEEGWPHKAEDAGADILEQE